MKKHLAEQFLLPMKTKSRKRIRIRRSPRLQTPKSSTSSKATKDLPSQQRCPLTYQEWVREGARLSLLEDEKLCPEIPSEISSTDYSVLMREALRLLLPSPISADSPWSGTGSTLKSVQILIPANPKSVQHGARVNLKSRRFYNDRDKIKYYDQIISEVNHQLPADPLQGLVVVSYNFYLPRPAYLKKPNSDPQAIPHPQKPDFENLAKGLGDALSRAGLWVDDKQVWAAFVFCMYHELALSPRIEITILHQ